MRGDDFISVIQKGVEDADQVWVADKFEVDGIEDGLVRLRRPVSGEVIGAYAALAGYLYDVGITVEAIPVGGGEWFILGPARSGASTANSPRIGQVYPDGRDATNAETLSTTNTVTYVDGLTLTTDFLPDGTYEVLALASANVAHSAGGSLDFRLRCGGTDDSGISVTSVSTTIVTPTRVSTLVKFGGVVVSGDLITVLQYRSGAAGTSSMRNPVLMIEARRMS